LLISRQDLCLFVGSYVDELASILTLGEENNTVNKRIDCVVLTHTHIKTGMMNSTALTLDDVTCLSVLTAKNLNAESFAFRLTSVLRTTYTFFMCHFFKILMG